ncbi:SET domain-containing protein [Hortaea werneckii]|nr:SET domain-containing protein [Hortaea werneckii]
MAPQVVIDLSKEDGVDDPPRKTQASRSNGLNPSKARVDRINSGMNEMRPSYRSTSLDRRQKRPNFGDWFAPKSHAAPNSQDRPSGSSAKLSTKQSSGYGRQHDTDRASSHSNLRTVDASSSSGNVNTFLGPASDRRKPSLPTARSSNGVSPAYAQPKGAAAAPIGGSPNSIGNAPHRSKIPSSVIDLLSDEEGENGAGEDLLLSKPKLHAESSSKADNGSMKNSKSSLHTGIVKEDQKSTRNGLDASASQTATVARDSPIQDQRSGLPLETLKTSDIREVRHNRANSRKEQLNNDVTRRNNAFSDDNHYSINALASRASTSNEDGLPAASTKLEKLQQAPTPRTLEARESTQSSEDRPSQKSGGRNKKTREVVLDPREEEPKPASRSDEEASNIPNSQASSGTARAASLSAQSKATSSRKNAAQEELHNTGSLQKPVAHDKKSDTLTLHPEAEIGSRPKAPLAVIGNTVKKANGGDASEADDGAMERSKSANLSNGGESQVLPPLVGKSDQAFASLSSAKQVEIIVGRYMDEVRVENEYWNKAWLRRARCSKAIIQQSADVSAAKPYSFAKLKPLPLIQAVKKSRSQGAVKLLVEKSVPGGKPMKVPFIVQPNIIEPHDDMPSYSHFVNIKSNFLAPNVTTLQHWPYFGDDFDYSEDAKGLKEQYSFDMDQRSTKLLRLAQAQKYEQYAEDALRELGIGWSDILRYLLEASPDVGSDPAAVKALKGRSESTSEDFCRAHTRTAQVLSSLPTSTPERLAKAALTCYHFHNLAWFSLWHIARKHQFKSLPEKQHGEDTPLNDATCRICLRFACPYHGEIEELEDSDEEADSDTKKAITTDIINPPAVNNRKRVGFNPAPDDASSAVIEPLSRKDPRQASYWEKGYKHKADERGPFYPCHHPGQTCESAECSCFENMVPCEKTCSCSTDCARRFKGCSCSTERLKKGQRLMCYEDERCVCYSLGRECDPDLCGSCGVLEVLDPVNREREDPMHGRCRNACIQFGRPARTLLGQSGIHGFGLYAGQTIRQHDFVGEYKGEIITKEEAERRGAVYEKQQLSYLFTLNAVQEIDSTYFGNNIRFINHAGNGKNNLYPRIFMVNTVHRIALFADKTIQKGEELLFDYGPKFPDEQLGGKKAYQPRVRNSNMVHDFWEVEVERDATGYRRARKAAKPAGKGKARKTDAGAVEKAQKQHRGPLSGAGGRPRKNASIEEADAQSLEPDERLSAGDRLAAFNVAFEPAGEEMGLDTINGADDEDEFEPESSGDSNSEDDDEQDDEEPGPARRSRRGRPLKARRPRD